MVGGSPPSRVLPARTISIPSKASALRARILRKVPTADITINSLEPRLFWELIGENIDFINFRCTLEKITGFDFFHQGRCYLATEVRLTASFVIERVENGES